jgi:hypothetical protein
MSDILKTLAQRGIQSVVTAVAAYLAGAGYLTHDQEQSFIGALFFLAAWAVDTFIVHRQKANAAVAGGEAVATVASDDFSPARVKAIVKGVPK